MINLQYIIKLIFKTLFFQLPLTRYQILSQYFGNSCQNILLIKIFSLKQYRHPNFKCLFLILLLSLQQRISNSQLFVQMLNQNESIQLKAQSKINQKWIVKDNHAQKQNSKGNIRNDDLMKFLDPSSAKSAVKPAGKRCFSNSNAASKDLPDHLHMFKTLMVTSINKKNDLKPHQNPQTDIFNHKLNTQRKGFDAHKNYFSVSRQGEELDKKIEFLNEYSSTIQHTERPFNRKISDYSNFIQQNIKNEWSNQHPLMGAERNFEGRRIRNIQRDSIIDQKMRTRESFLKTFHTSRLNRNESSSQNSRKQIEQTNRNMKSMSSRKNRSKKQLLISNNHLIFSEKSRLRTNRNQIAKQLHEDTDSYMVKAKRSGLHSHHSSELYKTTQIQPEPTTNLGSPSRTIKYTTFDILITKYQHGGQKKKVHTHFQTDIAHESNRQMIANIEKWAGENPLQRLPQCSSPSRNIKRTQKSGLAN